MQSLHLLAFRLRCAWIESIKREGENWKHLYMQARKLGLVQFSCSLVISMSAQGNHRGYSLPLQFVDIRVSACKKLPFESFVKVPLKVCGLQGFWWYYSFEIFLTMMPKSSLKSHPGTFFSCGKMIEPSTRLFARFVKCSSNDTRYVICARTFTDCFTESKPAAKPVSTTPCLASSVCSCP